MVYTSKPAIWFPAIRAGSGADVFTERLAEGLRRRGLRAEITWLPHRAEYAPWTVAVPKTPAWANIAHVNTWLPRRFVPAALPFVATMHLCVHDPALALYKSRAQAFYHHFWVRKIEQEVLARAQRIIAVSHYTAEQMKATYGTPDTEIIHNGIDLSGVFQPTARAQPHRPFRLLFVGNWTSRKGADLLAPIMAALGPDFELHYTADRRADNQPTGLPSSAHCLGRLTTLETMAYAYQNADALLFPSRLEGFGLVALEAQVCGLPVIATRASSLPEVVADGETGLLCPQDGIQAFTAAAHRLADDPALWQRMREAARARAEARFSIELMINRYVAIYCKALASSYVAWTRCNRATRTQALTFSCDEHLFRHRRQSLEQTPSRETERPELIIRKVP